jgi:hypothetical protein
MTDIRWWWWWWWSLIHKRGSVSVSLLVSEIMYVFLEVLKIELLMRDFRLPPRCRGELHSSGMLQSVEWLFGTATVRNYHCTELPLCGTTTVRNYHCTELLLYGTSTQRDVISQKSADLILNYITQYYYQLHIYAYNIDNLFNLIHFWSPWTSLTERLNYNIRQLIILFTGPYLLEIVNSANSVKYGEKIVLLLPRWKIPWM